MKTALVFLLVMIQLSVFAQLVKTDTSKFFPPGNRMALGTAVGEKFSTSIGKEGGKIISGDKKTELIFPEGALTSPTQISLQPIINNAPAGNGNGYQFEPSGILFQKPVHLIFHYSDSDVVGTKPLLKIIYTQDSSGLWKRIKNISFDTVNKIVTADIFHFSNYSLADMCKLLPRQSAVKVNSKEPLGFAWPGPFPDNLDSLANANWGAALRTLRETAHSKWYVNDIEGGDDIAGTITPVAGDALSAVTMRQPIFLPLTR